MLHNVINKIFACNRQTVLIFVSYCKSAALATELSQCVAGVLPLIWFISKKNTSALRFVKTGFELKPMLKACANGASEMLSSISGSITGILYNLQLMKYAGEDGVAAYGVVMYAAFVFLGVFVGYSQGSSPIMGYHFGAQNHKEMKNVLKRSLILPASSGIVLTALAVLFARSLARKKGCREIAIFASVQGSLFHDSSHSAVRSSRLEQYNFQN